MTEGVDERGVPIHHDPGCTASAAGQQPLATAGDDPGRDRVREALESYVADPDGAGATILLSTLEPVVGRDAAYKALGMKPPKPGLVYCCATLGWVTPHEAAEHRYESGFGMD